MQELKYVYYINAEPQTVWDALKAGQPVVTAVPGTALETTFESGAEYAYVGKAGGDGSQTLKYVYGKILSAQAPQRVEMTYHSMAGPQESRVVYELEPAGGGKYTKLKVTQDGFADNDPNYAMNQDGWPQLLSNLKSVIETGKVMNYHQS